MEILDKKELHLKIGKNGLLADNSELDYALKYEGGIKSFDEILNDISPKEISRVVKITKYPKGIRITLEKNTSKYHVGVPFDEIQNVNFIENLLDIKLNSGKSISFSYQGTNRKRIKEFFNTYIIKHLLSPTKLSFNPIAENKDGKEVLQREAKLTFHVNKIMKFSAIMLFAIMIFVSSIIIYSLIDAISGDYLIVEDFLGLPFIALLFLISRYYYKISKREDIAAFNKEILISKLVSGLIGVIGGVISIIVFQDYGLIGLFPLSGSLMLIIAFILAFRNKIDPTYTLLIIGGVMLIPIGIFTILAGVRLKKLASLGYE